MLIFSLIDCLISVKKKKEKNMLTSWEERHLFCLLLCSHPEWYLVHVRCSWMRRRGYRALRVGGGGASEEYLWQLTWTYNVALMTYNRASSHSFYKMTVLQERSWNPFSFLVSIQQFKLFPKCKWKGHWISQMSLLTFDIRTILNANLVSLTIFLSQKISS